MPRPTSLAFFAVLAGVAALLVAWGLTWSRTRVLSERIIEVRGRLLDEATGQPLAGVGVLALRFESAATDPKTLASFAWRTAATRVARAGGPSVDEQSIETIYANPESHMLTAKDGRYQVRIRDRHCRAYVNDEPVDPTPWPDRSGLHGILVERLGAAPWVLTPPPHGAWTRDNGARHDPDYVWDLGEVRVPAAK